jgi:hypothetical protein
LQLFMPKHARATDRLGLLIGLGWLIGLGRRAPDPQLTRQKAVFVNLQRPGRSLPSPRPSIVVGTGVSATEGR